MKPLAQSIAISLKSELSEIENVTEVNGCFLLRAPENKIVESTIPLNINADILWEVCVLRDTFQQFSEGLEHGDLKEITLQGNKGFIFLRKLNREFILLAMAPNTVNLGYFKLAMIDIINRINQKINSLQDEEIAEMVQNAIEAEDSECPNICGSIRNWIGKSCLLAIQNHVHLDKSQYQRVKFL